MAETTQLHPKLLAALVCPRCHGELRELKTELECTVCGTRYPIVHGIPIFIKPESAPKNGASVHPPHSHQ